ncbi:MAG: N-acetyltransferase [Candidatus Bathyarchaeota archaeon]|nr:MAG: N-acetyltransferase [Candidatus Bathyarchaeota archaeon]
MFSAKDGRTVLLRKPRWDDLDGLLALINSLVREDAPINRMAEVSRLEESEFLTKRLSSIENGAIIQVVAEVDGEIVGNAEISKLRGREAHVGRLGIGVKRDYRRIGIATRMIESLLHQAEEHGLKIILLAVYANNLSAITLYRKFGFREIGRTPKGVRWKDAYVDDIRMVLEIA